MFLYNCFLFHKVIKYILPSKNFDFQSKGRKRGDNYEKNYVSSCIIINLNDTYTLIATVSPENASDKTVSFTSQDTSVATIDNNGIIRAVGKGTTTITVTPKGGGTSSTCIVTVN